METLALRYNDYGAPDAVLRLETMETDPPKTGDVCIQLQAATVNPSDIGMIGGSYGRLQELPAVGGREGIGKVIATGDGVTGITVGDWVRMPEALGAWRSRVTASAESLTRVPNDLPVEQAAMAFINPPTAVMLLEQFVDLQPGDWVIQNAANSAVGFCVTALAKKMGLHSIAVVRNVAKWEGPLSEAGADAVVADGEDFHKQVKAITGGNLPRLALNSIGGDSVIKLIRSVADQGVVVTFGGMVGDKIRFPTRNLIFNDVALRGFWLDRWMRTNNADAVESLLQKVYGHIREKTFQVPIDATYALTDGVAAVTAAAQGSRRGKVIIASAEVD